MQSHPIFESYSCPRYSQEGGHQHKDVDQGYRVSHGTEVGQTIDGREPCSP